MYHRESSDKGAVAKSKGVSRLLSVDLGHCRCSGEGLRVIAIRTRQHDALRLVNLGALWKEGKHGVRKCGESRFAAGDDTCLIDRLRALVVLGNQLRIFLLVVNQVKSRAAAAVSVPGIRGR